MAVKKKRRLINRKKRSLDPKIAIDYKRPDVLKRFITDRGKIIPRRISGATAKQQREICKAVKRARYLAILPYSVAHRSERGFVGMVSLSYAGFDRTRSRGGMRGDFRPSYDRNKDDRHSSNRQSGPGSRSEAPRSDAPRETSSAPKTDGGGDV